MPIYIYVLCIEDGFGALIPRKAFMTREDAESAGEVEKARFDGWCLFSVERIWLHQP